MPFTQEQILNRSFELALFIRGDDRIAKEITAKILAYYEIDLKDRYKKRDYNRSWYAFINRKKSDGGPKRCAFSPTENYEIQRLVLAEATQVKPSELRNQSEAEMITYYLAWMLSLARMKNPFHITTGFSTLVHGYSDSQTASIYERLKLLAQLPEEQYSELSQYRRFKSVLSKDIEDWFGDVIDLGARIPANDKLRSLIKSCGAKLSPWVESDTQSRNDLTIADRKYLDGKETMGDKERDKERMVACIQAVVNQESYRRLVEQANSGLPLPGEKLRLPRFAVTSEWKDPESRPPTDQERDEILRLVSALRQNRQAEKSDWIVCYADTEEVCRFRAYQGRASFEVDDTTRLLKFFAENGGRKNWLATVPLNLDERLYEDGPMALESRLNWRRKLSFDLSLRRDGDGDVDGAYVGLEYSEVTLADLLRPLFPFETLTGWQKVAWAAGVAAVLLMLGFFLIRKSEKPSEVVITPPQPKISSPSPTTQLPLPEQNVVTAHRSAPKASPKPLRVKLIGTTEDDKDLLARVAPKIKVSYIQIVSEGKADIELPVEIVSAPGDSNQWAEVKGSDIGLQDIVVSSFSKKGSNRSQSFDDKVADAIVKLLKQASRQKRK